jgi:hypothetical protein
LKLLENPDLKLVSSELSELINENPENLIEAINQLLFNRAKDLNKVFKVDDSLKLSESRSKESLA